MWIIIFIISFNLAGTKNKLLPSFSQIEPIISSTFFNFLANHQVCIVRDFDPYFGHFDQNSILQCSRFWPKFWAYNVGDFDVHFRHFDQNSKYFEQNVQNFEQFRDFHQNFRYFDQNVEILTKMFMRYYIFFDILKEILEILTKMFDILAKNFGILTKMFDFFINIYEILRKIFRLWPKKN